MAGVLRPVERLRLEQQLWLEQLRLGVRVLRLGKGLLLPAPLLLRMAELAALTSPSGGGTDDSTGGPAWAAGFLRRGKTGNKSGAGS